jgi:hypothetical protein
MQVVTYRTSWDFSLNGMSRWADRMVGLADDRLADDGLPRNGLPGNGLAADELAGNGLCGREKAV